jgi:large subunit ribosomal protein L29
MKAKEVHKLSDEELGLEVNRLRRRVVELRTQAVTEKIEDTSQFPKIRKDIARLLTEQSTRRLGGRAETAASARPGGTGKSKRAKAGRTKPGRGKSGRARSGGSKGSIRASAAKTSTRGRIKAPSGKG